MSREKLKIVSQIAQSWPKTLQKILKDDEAHWMWWVQVEKWLKKNVNKEKFNKVTKSARWISKILNCWISMSWRSCQRMRRRLPFIAASERTLWVIFVELTVHVRCCVYRYTDLRRYVEMERDKVVWNAAAFFRLIRILWVDEFLQVWGTFEACMAFLDWSRIYWFFL